jgi:hypothetical protein
VPAGLAGERTRWESSISGYESFLAALPGDTLLAAAFLSYAGPFPSEFRDELVKGTWMPQVGAATGCQRYVACCVLVTAGCRHHATMMTSNLRTAAVIAGAYSEHVLCM